MQEDFIVDVENYTDDEKILMDGKIFYTTGQMAKMLGEPDSTVKYYCNFFSEILKIKKVNDRWQFKESDIEKFRYIIKLRDSGMKLKQIKDYCDNVEFDKNNNNKAIVKEDNPLSIQAVAQALLQQQEMLMQKQQEILKEYVENIKSEIVENTLTELKEFINKKSEAELDGFEVLKEDIGDIVSKKLDSVTNSITEIKESMNMKFVSRDELENYTKKKSLWNKLLKRG